MKIIGLNHFQLDSLDVEKTRKFYESLGGHVTQVMERDGGWKGYHIKLCDGLTVEIQPPRLPEECGGWNGWDHVALETDNCEKAAQLIETLGGRIEKQPTPNFLGDTPIVNAVTYGVDGEKIEVIQFNKNSEGDGKIKKLNHVQLNTDAVEKTRLFYEKAFGGRVLGPIMQKDGSGIKGYFVEIVPGFVIEMTPPRFPFDGKTSAWNTIAIETDDIEDAIRQIVDAGGIREVGPMTGTMGTINMLNAVVIGPADEHIELIQITD